MSEQKKRAAGYVRVSTAGQVEGESLQTQRQQIKDFAKQKGWELVDIYADEGLSGAKVEHRTAFQKMLKDAKAGKFEIIVFYKLSRFARNAREYMNLSHELEQQGVVLASIKENIDPTTKTGKMIAGILALFAEWEHETIYEQMHDNKMASWREQRSFIGKPPYGYRWNKEKQELEVDEREAEIYQWIVKMYVDQGLSFRDIIIKLREHGIKCKRKDWTPTTLSHILKNPCYYGHYVLNQYVYEDSATQGAGKKRTKQMKPSSEHITFPIPAIISKQRWDQIQAKTDFNKVKSKKSNRTKEFFLRDVLICGRCGSRVKPRVGNDRKDGSAPRYYCCYWAGTSKKNIEAANRKKCSLPFVKAKTLENRVWSDIKMMFNLNPEKAFGQLFDPEKYEAKIEDLQEQINRLEADLKKKQRARKNLFKFMEDDDMDADELRDRLRANKDEILELEGNIENAQVQLKEVQEARDREKEIGEFLLNNKDQLKQLRHDIANLSYEDRKILVEGMLDGDIIVNWQDNDPEEGPGGPESDYKLKWNAEILQRLIDEEKVSKLDKNSCTYFNLIHKISN